MRHILAIDMGKNKSVFCDYLEPEGTHAFGTLATSPTDFHDLIVARAPDVVVIEAGPMAGWVCDLCAALGVLVKVVNTAGEQWKWKNVKDKSDRDDGLKLARMEAMSVHDYVHVPTPAVRQWRELIAYRDDYVARVTAAKNRIRSILDRRGQRWPAGKKGWTAAAVQELEKDARPLCDCGPDELWRGMLRAELAYLRRTADELAEVEKKLDQIAQASERVKRLKTVPGVGNRTAEVVVAMLDDPRRFKNGRQVGCYAGLTPRRRQSGTMELDTHISRAGSGLLRKMLVQASWIGQLSNPWMKGLYEQVCRGSKTRRKVAIVAVARRLLVRLWAMDRDQKDWAGPAALRRPGRTAAPAPV